MLFHRQLVAESKRYDSHGQLRAAISCNQQTWPCIISMAQGVEEVLVAADAAELDLTNAHLRNLDDVPLPESLSVRQFGMCPM